VTAQALEN